ncbi:MAG TPA: tRNA (adenosine(37)-N6)-threonylcarbamoyltransferase complex dimerization subunit type 1 TsaB, partial [Longimicrobium sp.]
MTEPVAGPVLALDSSTRGGSVAVGVDGRVAAERVLPPSAGASSLLMPAVDEAVRTAGLSPRDLAAVAVAGGPGSFTGLRIAAATAKAIVRALGVPLFAWSGLMAAAATLRLGGRPVCALFDARNREVFAGCWRFAEGSVDEILAPCILKVDDVIERVRGSSPLFTGDGAALHAAVLEAAAGAGTVSEHGDESPAAGLLWLARAVPRTGRVAQPA